MGWLVAMAGVVRAAAVVAGRLGAGFEVEYRLAGGGWRREPLAVCAGERFEEAAPVRPFHFEKGLGSFAGWWWAATTGSHVGFESWLERDHLMLLDFDRDVTAMASQP